MSNAVQRSFASGEVAPALYGRVDQVAYATGLKTCRNHEVMRHGGVQNRPGTEYVGEVKTSSNGKVRLIPFIFNDTTTYVLEFGNLYMRVIKDGAVLQSGGGAYEVVTPYVTADLQTLNYAQSGDILTIVHPNYAPRQLTRTGDTSWTLSTITFAPVIGTPTNVSPSGTAGSNTYSYNITAVDKDTGEEGLAGSGVVANVDPPGTNDHTITWDSVTDADYYRVYIFEEGLPSYIGETANLTFTNDGITPDIYDQPPAARNPFDSTNNYPSAVAYYQQRLVLANTNNNPETVWTSRTGLTTNFTVSTPSEDTDAVTFRLWGSQVNKIKHMMDLNYLVVFTSGAEWSIRGNSAGILTPDDINPKPHTYNGSGDVAPVIVTDKALYLQARAGIVRDFAYDVLKEYSGRDLTLRSPHLLENYTITDWAYQQIPHSILWMVRSDGTLLGLTYVDDEDVLGWHRHDTDGTVENVCVIPEGDEDTLYLVVNRTIDGSTVRYIERMKSRVIDEDALEDMVLMDCAKSYDGENTGATTLTLSSAGGWGYEDYITITASVGTFASTDVDNARYDFTDASGEALRVTVKSYTSPTVVKGTPNRTVPADLRNSATATWSKAVKKLTGLDHLEGEDVSIFGDSYVEASPNNESYDTVTVASGEITLSQPYVRVHVGLPYTSDIETLDVDTVNGETLMDKRMNVQGITAFFKQTWGIFAGPAFPTGSDLLEGLYELKIRDNENYDEVTNLLTGKGEIMTECSWNDNGRGVIRTVDPIPVSVLSLTVSGYIPYK